MIRKARITFPSCQESTIKSQTCLGRSLCVQSWVCKQKQLPEHEVFHWSQGLEEEQGHGTLLQCVAGGTPWCWGHAVLEGQKTSVSEHDSSVSFTEVLIILMSPSVCSRRFFMGCIQGKVSSHTGCTWRRTGLKVRCSGLCLPYWLWEEILRDHYQYLSGKLLWFHIAPTHHNLKKTALKGFVCAIFFAFWVG